MNSKVTSSRFIRTGISHWLEKRRAVRSPAKRFRGNRRQVLFIALFVSLPLAVLPSDPVAELNAELREALGKLAGKSDKLDSQYLEALDSLLARAEVAGDPARTALVRQEIDHYHEEKSRPFSEFPPLAKLREVYDKNRARIESGVMPSRIALLRIYRERFEKLEQSLSEAGKIETAVRARLRLDEVAKCLANPAEISDLLALWSMTTTQDVENVADANLVRKDGRYLISSKRKAGSRVATRASFRPPFEISTRVSTDSVNIRYYIGPRVITIFNWEVKPTQLRLHDPRGGVPPTAIDDKGYVEEDEMHEIRIQLREDKMAVYADGEFRGMLSGDFSGVQGKVGIGPAFGSTLALERFVILPLRNTKEIVAPENPD